MLVEYKISKDIIVKLEGDDATSLFEQIHSINEGFKPEPCGKCGSDSVHAVRENGGDKYYELQCTSLKCRAKLSVSIEKKSKKLYKKRTKVDGDGRVVKEDGKTVYFFSFSAGTRGTAAKRPVKPALPDFFCP